MSKTSKMNESEKKYYIGAVIATGIAGIPLIFLFLSGLENRGVVYASLMMAGAISFLALFSRIVSKCAEKYCEKNGISLAVKKTAVMSGYDPGLAPTMFVKISRLLTYLFGGLIMWYLSTQFDFNYPVIAVVAGVILGSAIQGKDVTVDLDEMNERMSEKKKK